MQTLLVPEVTVILVCQLISVFSSNRGYVGDEGKLTLKPSFKSGTVFIVTRYPLKFKLNRLKNPSQVPKEFYMPSYW